MQRQETERSTAYLKMLSAYVHCVGYSDACALHLCHPFRLDSNSPWVIPPPKETAEASELKSDNLAKVNPNLLLMSL